jgi:asparagine synthase (glutamine-hydrolysing)
MTSASSLLGEPADDSWVLAISLKHPGRPMPNGVQWAELGTSHAFFHGLLLDRETLVDPADRGQAECSDADLVLRAYRRGGDGALLRLRGSFVLAILDPARDMAIVMRDPLGSHPLFYVETSSQVLFAGSPRPLLDRPEVSRAFNRAALADHLCYRWPDLQETFFAAVRRVPPSWRAIVKDGRLQVHRFWDPMPVDQPMQWLTAEEISQFDGALEQAVNRCLGHGPTGIYLSGGLDSISVAAFAADLARRNGRPAPWALSLAFPDPTCDERDRQAAVARGLGLRQHLVEFDEALGSRPLSEQWIELNLSLHAPILNIWQPAYLALAERAKLDGVATIMTGHGGDEWLTVTPALSADLIRRGAFVELAQLFRTYARSYQRSPAALARHLIWTRGLRPLAAMMIHRGMPAAHRRRRLRGLGADDPAWVAPDRDLRSQQLRRAERALPSADPPEGFYMRDMRRAIDHPLTSWDSEERFALGKRIGISFRHPFLDPDLVQMLYRTPPHALNEGGRTKSLVRQTIARRFPGLELERQRKVAGTSYFQALLLRELPALADAAGDFPALSASGVIDGQATGAVIREGLAQGGLKRRQAWDLVNLELWAACHSR